MPSVLAAGAGSRLFDPFLVGSVLDLTIVYFPSFLSSSPGLGEARYRLKFSKSRLTQSKPTNLSEELTPTLLKLPVSLFLGISAQCFARKINGETFFTHYFVTFNVSFIEIVY